MPFLHLMERKIKYITTGISTTVHNNHISNRYKDCRLSKLLRVIILLYVLQNERRIVYLVWLCTHQTELRIVYLV